MPILPITTITAAVMGLLLLILSLRVVQGRLSGKVGMGDGGDSGLLTRIRSQANLTEYVPIILILMALIERAGGRGLWLEIAAVLLVVSRLIHPIGMTRPGPNILRGGGMVLTLGVLAWLSIWALVIAVRLSALT